MPAMLTWVEGTPVAMYTYKDFIAKGGSIRILKAEKEGGLHIDATEDFESRFLQLNSMRAHAR